MKEEKKQLLLVYNDLVNLRNRLSNNGNDVIYEEDHLLLDKVLDLLENSMFLHYIIEKMLDKEGI